MAVEYFASAATQPSGIFCDTSFLMDILTHELSGTIGPLIANLDAGKRLRAAEASAFFQRYSAAGVRFFSSPYTFQELAHALGRGVLRGIAPKFGAWKDLERKDAITFQVAHKRWMKVVEDSWVRLQRNGVVFTVPITGDETDHGSRVDTPVVETARQLKLNYASLDVADTFHIAMGLACGLEWFATVDAPWKAVAEINVFANI